MPIKRLLFGAGALTLILCQSSVFASSGADVLLKSVGEVPENVEAESASSLDAFKLNDPFLSQLYYRWRSEPSLPYDVNAWIRMVLSQRFEKASHLWSSVEEKVPESFRVPAIVTQLYLLWRLDLSQTFFDQWTYYLSDPKVRASKLLLPLHDLIRKKVDHWLKEQAILIPPNRTLRFGQSLSENDPIRFNLKVWASLRPEQSGEEAAKYLSVLASDHAFVIPLAKKAVLEKARQGDLAEAGKILKKHLEPAVGHSPDAVEAAEYYLLIARLLYQAGSLEAAEHFYQKVPNGSPQYFEAREELAWVWLRTGELESLRGEVKTLTSPLFDKEFSPERFVVRAISNLKLCHYDRVRKDFEEFQRVYLPVAKEISQALKSEDPKPLNQNDFYLNYAMNALHQRQKEADRLQALAKRSITAVLPAVGPQKHWLDYQKKIKANVEVAKKMVSEQLRRQWKNRATMLSEAIRKMRFVRVELLSQLRTLADRERVGKGDQIRITQAKDLRASRDQQIFPFDGVTWPDELFKLKGITNGHCL